MKKLTLLALTLYFYIPLHSTEDTYAVAYYQEFLATMHIASSLYELVNETDIDVKSATSIKDEKVFLQSNPDWNTTDQGLIAYFEEDHLTRLFTPFGDWMVFWHTLADKKWDHVTEKFKETCTLDQNPLVTQSGKVDDSYAVLSVNYECLPKPTKIMQGNQDRKVMLIACIAKYLHDGGTVTNLESLDKRKKRHAKLSDQNCKRP